DRTLGARSSAANPIQSSTCPMIRNRLHHPRPSASKTAARNVASSSTIAPTTVTSPSLRNVTTRTLRTVPAHRAVLEAGPCGAPPRVSVPSARQALDAQEPVELAIDGRRVSPPTADENVLLVVPREEAIIAEAAVQQVAAGAADEHVVPVPAEEPVGAAEALDHVVAAEPAD